MKQRNTRQKKLVFDAVRGMRTHPCADSVYLKLREKDPHISRGTVYRNLNLLVKNGDIRHVRLPGVNRFDWRIDPHYHIVCTQCGKVVDAPVPYESAADRSLASSTGFQINGHIKVFEGLCPACRMRADEGEETDGDAASESPREG